MEQKGLNVTSADSYCFRFQGIKFLLGKMAVWDKGSHTQTLTDFINDNIGEEYEILKIVRNTVIKKCQKIMKKTTNRKPIQSADR